MDKISLLPGVFQLDCRVNAAHYGDFIKFPCLDLLSKIVDYNNSIIFLLFTTYPAALSERLVRYRPLREYSLDSMSTNTIRTKSGCVVETNESNLILIRRKIHQGSGVGSASEIDRTETCTLYIRASISVQSA